MIFSEAIRLGSMIRPQAFGKMYDRIGSCALGAAFEAIGKKDVIMLPIPEWAPVFEAPCPICHTHQHEKDLCTIAHLNDHHRWTREQIADWVESVELKNEVPHAASTATS